MIALDNNLDSIRAKIDEITIMWRAPISDDARRRRTEAVAWLSRVADGSIELPSATSVASNATRGSPGAITGEERLLSRDELAGH